MVSESSSRGWVPARRVVVLVEGSGDRALDLRRGDAGRYLQNIEGLDRAALERVYAIARDVVPEAVEGTSHAMAALPYRGKGPIAAVRATRFLSLYPISGPVISRHRDLLAGVETTTGSIHYLADHSLPGETLRRIVQSRREEIDAGAG